MCVCDKHMYIERKAHHIRTSQWTPWKWMDFYFFFVVSSIRINCNLSERREQEKMTEKWFLFVIENMGFYFVVCVAIITLLMFEASRGYGQNRIYCRIGVRYIGTMHRDTFHGKLYIWTCHQIDVHTKQLIQEDTANKLIEIGFDCFVSEFFLFLKKKKKATCKKYIWIESK